MMGRLHLERVRYVADLSFGLEAFDVVVNQQSVVTGVELLTFRNSWGFSEVCCPRLKSVTT